jgi:hypothetical protein
MEIKVGIFHQSIKSQLINVDIYNNLFVINLICRDS